MQIENKLSFVNVVRWKENLKFKGVVLSPIGRQ